MIGRDHYQPLGKLLLVIEEPYLSPFIFLPRPEFRQDINIMVSTQNAFPL